MKPDIHQQIVVADEYLIFAKVSQALSYYNAIMFLYKQRLLKISYEKGGGTDVRMYATDTLYDDDGLYFVERSSCTATACQIVR